MKRFWPLLLLVSMLSSLALPVQAATYAITAVASTASAVQAQSLTVSGVVNNGGVPAPGAQVTLSWKDPNTALKGISQVATAVDGSYSATFIVPNNPLLGAWTVDAAGGNATATATFTVVAGPLATIAVSPSAAQTAPGGSSLTFTAAGFDSNNNPMTLSNPVWATAAATGGATGTVSAGGVLTAGHPGTLQVTATSAAITGTSGVITIVLGPVAAVSITSGDTVGAGSTLPLTATGSDAAGNPVVGASFTWTAAAGTGVGSVTGSTLTGSQPGTVTLTGTSGGVNATKTVTVFKPSITSPAGQSAAKSGDTLTFSGTVGSLPLTIASAKLIQYSDAGGATSLGVDIALTPGTDLALSGASLSGSKTVSSFAGTAQSVALQVTLQDGAGNLQTATSAPVTVQVAPATFTPTLSAPAGRAAVKSGDTVSFGGAASAAVTKIVSAKVIQYSDNAATTAIGGADISLTPNTDITLTGGSIGGSKAVASFDPTAKSARLQLVVADGANNQITVTSAAVLPVLLSVPAAFTPALSAPAGQTAVKNADTVSFGGTASSGVVKVVSARVVQYSDAGATTAIAGADITLTPGTNITLTGSSIGGSQAVATFNVSAQAIKLQMVVADGADNQTTVTSAALPVMLTPLVSFIPGISFPGGQVAFKDGDTLTFTGVASASGLSIISATLIQYSDQTATTAISGANIDVTTAVTLTGTSVGGSKAVATFNALAQSIKLQMVVADAANNTITVNSPSGAVDTIPSASFTPTVTIQSGNPVVVHNDVLLFAGTAGESGLSIKSASLVVYAGTTPLTPITLTPGTHVTLSGTTIGGSYNVGTLDATITSLVLKLVVADGADNRRTVLSAPVPVDNQLATISGQTASYNGSSTYQYFSSNRPAAITATANKSLAWTATVKDPYGNTMATTTQTAVNFSWSWAPADAHAASGNYSVTLQGTDSMNRTASAVTVTIPVYNYSFKVNILQFLNSSMVPTTTVTSTGDYYVEASVTNLDPSGTTPLVLIQIRSATGAVELFNLGKFPVSANGQATIDFLVRPSIGAKSVDVFIWNQMLPTGRQALTVPLTITQTVN